MLITKYKSINYSHVTPEHLTACKKCIGAQLAENLDYGN